MRWFYKLPLRFRSFFEQELTVELRLHLEKRIEEYVAKGMTPEEARYAALRELGGLEQIKEECRDMYRVRQKLQLEPESERAYAIREILQNVRFENNHS